MKASLYILTILLIQGFAFSQEVCDNGIDDDLDGLIDLQDTTDCFCQLVKADSSLSSLIPNPSFESRTCCPSAASQLSCANNWVQASGATSDYFNTCGLRAIGTWPQPPLPLPDGNGYVGFFNNFFPAFIPVIYKEYVGTCLTDTTEIGVNYQIEFFLANSFGNLSTELAIFGSTNCSSLPFGTLLPTATSLCPTAVAPADWDLLAADTFTCSGTSWVKVSLNFTATKNYSAIILGPSCGNNTGSNYYYIDNLILNKTSLFVPKVGIIDSGNYCQNNLILKADFDSFPRFFQWYRDSIAIVGATDSTYSVPNGQLGNYQLLATYDSLCVITEVYKVDTTIIQFKLDSSGTCPTGLQTGEILVSNVKSGTSPYQFQLNNSSFVNDSSFAGLSSGLYTVTVQDSNGCQGVQTITVDSFPQPIASFLTDSVCFGTPSNFIDQSILSSGSITDLRWSLPGSPSITNTSFTFPTDGNFPVTLTVVSDSGCVDDTTLISVVHPLPNASFTFTPQELYTFNPDVCFINQSTGAISYLWDFDFTGVNGTSTLSDPCTVRFPADEEKVYQVTLFAETEFGCIDSTTANVSILDEFLIYIPSAFSPNDDGLNDEFVITAAGVQSLSFQLFNRWGEQVFNSTETNPTWDGKYQGELVPIGIYPYRAIVGGQNGVVKEFNGHVTVVR
jgi:gliding motility-associated-like protein